PSPALAAHRCINHITSHDSAHAGFHHNLPPVGQIGVQKNRGQLMFSYEAVREWEAKLTPILSDELRRRRRHRPPAPSWYVDETYVKVKGRWCYLYRAIDRNGALVDVMLSERRNLAAAKAFFRSAKSATGKIPDRVTSD